MLIYPIIYFNFIPSSWDLISALNVSNGGISCISNSHKPIKKFEK